ncbi:MAG: hypothetical protein NDJ92_02225 [Thermoanaerobaculia bacterium]|nr:hypothetical protein [Thermoanaerobaculia bacterium]
MKFSAILAVIVALFGGCDVGAASAVDPAVFETLLLPVVNRPTPGAYGSMWESRFSMYNGNAVALDPNPLVPDFFPLDSGCQFPSCPPIPVVPAESRHEPLLFQPDVGGPPGILLYAKREFVEKLSFSLGIQDVSRQALTWGTEIPVVRESELFTTTLQLFDVPTDARFRQALRVYDPDGKQQSLVRLDIYSSDDEFIATITLAIVPPPAAPCNVPTGVACFPSTVQVLSLADQFPEIRRYGLVRIAITPLSQGLRFWAFVSVTNNETQHVTTITPQ